MAKTIRYDREMFKEYREKGYWDATTLADVWDRNAQDYPDDEAIVDSQTRLTWGDAKTWIDRLALGFLELGYKRDDMIVVQLPNSVELCLEGWPAKRRGCCACLFYEPGATVKWSTSSSRWKRQGW